MNEQTESLSPAEDGKTKKSAGAFRTISEVSDELGVQQHVLRFWETKFTQVKPLKRGGGRRYYRPEDVKLLKHIHHLLYTEGYTIKGVQKLMKGQTKSTVLSANDATVAKTMAPAAANVAEKRPANDTGLSAEQQKTLENVLSELKEMRESLRTVALSA